MHIFKLCIHNIFNMILRRTFKIPNACYIIIIVLEYTNKFVSRAFKFLPGNGLISQG